ncbi:MAG TPA: DUF222 domain-containing protein [Solirubrobacteraceae bacterium]|nr:DUF222 domain-containing protein [Solirubrobacteraceae bacterium]
MCSTVDATVEVVEPEMSPVASLEALEREICELAAHIAVATCRWLELVAEFDDRGGWAEWGVKSCAHWLSWRCSIGLITARQHVRVAHRLRELPMTRAAFARGELSYCKVRALSRVAMPETEAGLVEIARHATGAQLEKLVRCYAGALSATLDTAQRAHDQRYLKWSWNDDGSLRLEARLPAAEGGMVVKALEAFEQEPEEEDAFARSPVAACRADALVAMARTAMDESAGSRTAASGSERCELVVHVDAATLVAERVGERCHVSSGPALAPETARRLGCDASVVRILERDGQPLTVARRTRTIPPAVRRALRSRDEGCRFPGCTHERHLHAHHIRHWARGGPTTLDNLVQLCSYHHRLVHEGGFGVEGGRGGAVRFRRPDGRVIAAVPGQEAAPGPGLAEQHRAMDVAVDASTCRPLSAGDRLDYDLAMDALLPKALATLIDDGRAVPREHPGSLQASAQLESAGGGDRGAGSGVP